MFKMFPAPQLPGFSLSILRLKSLSLCSSVDFVLRNDWFKNFRPMVCSLHNSSCLARWYKHTFRTKRVVIPRKNPPHFDFDWEHHRYKRANPDDPLPEAARNSRFTEIPDCARGLFTYKFISQSEGFNRQLEAKIMELGYHPLDDCAAVAVIRLTMKIRYKKALLGERHSRNGPLRCATESLVQSRWRALRRLRAVNMPEFERLMAALDIKTYKHPDVFAALTGTENMQRKKAVRQECYQNRLAKLALLKTQFATSEREFYGRKQQELTRILEELTALQSETDPNDHLAENEAKLQLRDLMNDVIEERQAEVLEHPRADQLKWFAKEAEMRERFAMIEAEKEAKQLRRARK